MRKTGRPDLSQKPGSLHAASFGGRWISVLALGVLLMLPAAESGAAPQTLLDFFRERAQPAPKAKAKAPRLPRAFRELRRKARDGDVEAMMRLARILDPAVEDVRMKGVRKSLAAAARWYRRAAQAGNRDAQFRLARIVHVGGKGIRQSAQTAFILYQAAAKQGHVPAMVWVAWMLEHGEGTRRDPRKAMEWYEKAAKAGDASAMTSLGILHLTGAAGVRDLRKAREWFEKAAAAGDAWAVNNLGAIHEKAWGVRQDLEQARQLYAQALEMGLELAAANLKRVEARLSKNEGGAGAGGAKEKTPAGAQPAMDSGKADRRDAREASSQSDGGSAPDAQRAKGQLRSAPGKEDRKVSP